MEKTGRVKTDKEEEKKKKRQKKCANGLSRVCFVST